MRGGKGPNEGPNRFWAKVVRGDGCWPWAGAIEKTGYGRVKWGGRAQMAHRVAYELAVGAIGDGLQIDHLCRNRACCNPAHLDAVTQRENILRSDSPNAIAHRTGRCARGHDLRVDAWVSSTGSRDCRICNRDRKRAARAARRAS